LWGLHSVNPFGTLFAYAPVSGAQKVCQPSGPGHFHSHTGNFILSIRRIQKIG
jgi:hypothetical protein